MPDLAFEAFDFLAPAAIDAFAMGGADIAEAGAEAIGAGGEGLMSLGEGAGDALAAGGTGLMTIGAGAGDALGAAAGGGWSSLGDIVGSGAGLAGGETGLAGTALAGGTDVASLVGGAGGAGPSVLGTAADFLANPGASGFNPSAITPQAIGGATSLNSAGLSSNVANANASASVFDTGTSGITGVNGAGGPSTVPGGGGAAALAAPSGVTPPVDATSIAGATSATSVGGAPLNAPPAQSSSIDSLLGKAGGGVMDSLTKNPLGVALGAGGLAFNVLNGQKQTANQKALAADAATATANSNQMVKSGEALQNYLTSGTLPDAYMQQVEQAIKDAKTSAISNAAQQGQPTDPTLNTALATTLARIDASKSGMISQVASQLFSSGSSLVQSGQQAAGLSGQLYQSLVQNDTAAAANTGKAIATLAAALNGKSQNTAGNITVSTG